MLGRMLVLDCFTGEQGITRCAVLQERAFWPPDLLFKRKTFVTGYALVFSAVLAGSALGQQNH
jgi:hypothetical protein